MLFEIILQTYFQTQGWLITRECDHSVMVGILEVGICFLVRLSHPFNILSFPECTKIVKNKKVSNVQLGEPTFI